MADLAKKIAITGGAGQIAYSLLFRIASGELFGPDQPIVLHILELPSALSALEGVKMELLDCAFPLLEEIVVTSDPYIAFESVDLALLVGSKPRGPGMERGDLLMDNGKIFVEQGKALNQVADPEVKVFVVGNPCNTNCLIAMHYAPNISRKNFFAMTRLDQNRAAALLAQKAHVPVTTVSHVAIWGNHSSTQVPDFIHARIGGKPVTKWITDREWLESHFVQEVRQRGAAIIKARGKSSAASAAQALLDAVRDVIEPNTHDYWFSSGVVSDANPYGVEDGLIFSFPCHANLKEGASIVGGLDIHEFLDSKIRESERELLDERDLVRVLLT